MHHGQLIDLEPSATPPKWYKSFIGNHHVRETLSLRWSSHDREAMLLWFVSWMGWDLDSYQFLQWDLDRA